MKFEHYLEKPYVYPIAEKTLKIRLKAKKGIAKKIYVLYKSIYNHDPENYLKKEMEILFQDQGYLYYEAECLNDVPYFKYNFQIITEKENFYFNIDGISRENNQKRYFFFPVINDYEIIKIPKELPGAISYQVLIDRFASEGRTNFNELSEPEKLPDRKTYYGGNYQGLRKKIPYLQSLNVELLYLSPLFKSPTYHKYDIEDYYELDEIYGSLTDLKELIDACRQAGIKVIFDGVFNHVSSENKLFKDVIEKGENSKYKAWFYIDSFPIDKTIPNYDTFGNKLVPSMPRLNTNNDEVIKYFTDVALYWTKKLNIAGWRLDVYDEVSAKFWREFRSKLKEYNEEIIIVGEIWEQSQRWLDGSQIDSFTNYRFRDLVLDLMSKKINVSKFWDLFKKHYLRYPSVYYNQFVNLLGSHDTTRLSSLFNLKQQQLALVLMLMFPGSPLLYYGDELGLEGAEDPDNRRAMRWDYLNHKDRKQLYESIVRATSLRKENKVLKEGAIIIENYGDQILAFTRKDETDLITCVFNLGEEGFVLPKGTKLLLGSNQEEIKNNEYAIFRREKK